MFTLRTVFIETITFVGRVMGVHAHLWSDTLDGNNHLEDLEADKRTILKRSSLNTVRGCVPGSPGGLL